MAKSFLSRLTGKGILLGLGGIGLVVGSWVYLSYRAELKAAETQLLTHSALLQTNCGRIEYGEAGQGEPVLLIHGAGGGYDQGLLLGNWIIPNGSRVIAPSRFGYVRSPIPQDDSLAAQTDAYACLLDSLGVQRVTVVAFSAGGPSGLQFALRYPERTKALILVSAVSFTEPLTAESRRETESAINRIIGSDFIYWAVIKAAPAQMLSLVGVSAEVQKNLSERDRGYALQVMDAMLPMSQRFKGILLDQSREVALDWPLDQIQAPTIVIHARNDTLVPFANGRHSAQHIPGAEFMALDDGGHFVLGHYDEIKDALQAFLENVP